MNLLPTGCKVCSIARGLICFGQYPNVLAPNSPLTALVFNRVVLPTRGAYHIGASRVAASMRHRRL